MCEGVHVGGCVESGVCVCGEWGCSVEGVGVHACVWRVGDGCMGRASVWGACGGVGCMWERV